MKIIHYCQYIWGVGHFFRSLEICRALAGHDVLLVTGGPQINASLPDHVREVRLPAIMTDRNYTNLSTTEKSKSFDQVKRERKKRLYDLFNKEAPDFFIVELYPFGRKFFQYELDPILKAIRNKALGSARVVCSLRDILVKKKDPEAFERRVIDKLNSYFDALLVHADPNLVRIDETFSRVDDILIPVVYTGFVAPKPAPDARERLRGLLGIGQDEFLVVASAGGGKVGARLLEPLVSAWRQIDLENSHHLHIFTGPFMSEAEFNHLQELAHKGVRVQRFTNDFLSYLKAADLSVSMAGYNTCMNILATRIPALVWPSSQDREQGFRAERLSRLGVLKILNEGDLHPSRLAAIIGRALSPDPQSRVDIDLNGAINTAKWLEAWVES